MATTSPDNIRYPVSTDQIAPLETHFANLANDVQTALTTTSTGGGVLIHKVASSAARDALYPSPIQGQQVFRNDTGLMQTYYGLYNVSTNPGGMATAGWYDSGTVRHQEWTASVVMASGSAVSSFGTLTLDSTKTNDSSLVTYNSSTGVFTISRAGTYSISLRSTGISGAVTNGRTFGLLATPNVAANSEYLDFKTIVNGDNIFFTISTPNFKITAATDFQFQLYQTSTASRTVPLRIAVTKIA